MVVGEVGLAHVCFQYLLREKKIKTKTAKKHCCNIFLALTATRTATPTLPIELCAEKKPTCFFCLVKIWSTALKTHTMIHPNSPRFPHFIPTLLPRRLAKATEPAASDLTRETPSLILMTFSVHRQ